MATKEMVYEKAQVVRDELYKQLESVKEYPQVQALMEKADGYLESIKGAANGEKAQMILNGLTTLKDGAVRLVQAAKASETGKMLMEKMSALVSAAPEPEEVAEEE